MARRTVEGWGRDGAPCDVRPYRFDLAELEEWLEASGRPIGRVGRPSLDDRLRKQAAEARRAGEVDRARRLEEQTETIEAAKLEKIRWDAQLQEAKTKLLRGELLDADDVEEARVERIHAVRTVLLGGLPKRLARRIAAHGDDVHAVAAEIRSALEDVAAAYAGGGAEAEAVRRRRLPRAAPTG